MLSSIGNYAALAASGLQLTKKVSQLDVAGILIKASNYTVIDKLQLGMTLRMEGVGEVQIVPEMPLTPLIEYGDFHGGVSWGALKEKELTATADGNELKEQDVGGFFIPLGQICVGGEDELEIQFTLTSALGAAETMNAWFVNLGKGDERIHKFSDQDGGNSKFNDPAQVFIYDLSAGTHDQDLSGETTGGVIITVRCGDEEKTFEGGGAWALAAALGKYEVSGPRRIGLVYWDIFSSNPGADVNVQITGTNKANYACFGVERWTHPRRVGISAAKLEASRNARLDRVAVSNPEKVTALAMQGRVRLPPSVADRLMRRGR